MHYTYTGKNTVVTEALKQRTEGKLARLKKLIPENTEVVVSYTVIKLDHKLEVTIYLPKRILRAEVTASDVFTALDEIVDILEKQIIKYKGRLRHKSRKSESYKAEYDNMFGVDSKSDEQGIKINKTKRFAIKPMDAEEAAMEMELLGHNFYVFRNGSSDEINVVYKRKDSSYGLIEPEY